MTARFLSYPLRLSTRFETFASTPVHMEMLRDTTRSLTFQRAINAVVKPGVRVLDIGAGSGILGLWALTAGAAHLDAIDATDIGGTLMRTFAANGFSGRAEAHIGHSGSVTLKEPADVVIAEVLGHFGIDEGILATCADARQRLAKPGAVFIPARVDVIAWPVWVPDFENDLVAFWRHKPYAYELDAMGELSRQATYACNEHDGQRIAASAVLASYDVGAPPPTRFAGRASFNVDFKSDWNGFFLSFTADLGAGISLDGFRTHSWKTVFLPAPKMTSLAKGSVVTLEIGEEADGSVRYSATP
ncbi:MAG: 50S ribosomal protein L11 methyltransferase [Myxococcota bacterium]